MIASSCPVSSHDWLPLCSVIFSFFVQPSGFDSEEIALHVVQKQSGVLAAPIAQSFNFQQCPQNTHNEELLSIITIDILDISIAASTQMLHKHHFSYYLIMNIKAYVANGFESCCKWFMESLLQIHHAGRISLWTLDSEKGGLTGMNSLLPFAGTVRLLGVAHYHHQPTASVWMDIPPGRCGNFRNPVA